MPNFDEQIDSLSRELIVDALRAAGWNYSKAARALPMHRSTLTSMCARLNIRERDDMAGPAVAEPIAAMPDAIAVVIVPLVWAVLLFAGRAWCEGVWTRREAKRIVQDSRLLLLTASERHARSLVVHVNARPTLFVRTDLAARSPTEHEVLRRVLTVPDVLRSATTMTLMEIA